MKQAEKARSQVVSALTGYVEHDRVAAVKAESQAIGQFLEWLSEEGLELARRHEHADGCYDEDGRLACGYRRDELAAEHSSIEVLLARYFDIDLNKLEAEKRAMLARLRERLDDARNAV